MDTRNCCSGCAGVDNVYSCSSPIRRAPAHTCFAQPQPVAVAVKKEESVSRGNATVDAMQNAVKKEESVSRGNATVDAMQNAVKKEESVRVVEAMPKATVFVKKEAVKVNA